jgi:hypothetical protein
LPFGICPGRFGVRTWRIGTVGKAIDFPKGSETEHVSHFVKLKVSEKKNVSVPAVLILGMAAHEGLTITEANVPSAFNSSISSRSNVI